MDIASHAWDNSLDLFLQGASHVVSKGNLFVSKGNLFLEKSALKLWPAASETNNTFRKHQGCCPEKVE